MNNQTFINQYREAVKIYNKNKTKDNLFACIESIENYRQLAFVLEDLTHREWTTAEMIKSLLAKEKSTGDFGVDQIVWDNAVCAASAICGFEVVACLVDKVNLEHLGQECLWLAMRGSNLPVMDFLVDQIKNIDFLKDPTSDFSIKMWDFIWFNQLLSVADWWLDYQKPPSVHNSERYKGKEFAEKTALVVLEYARTKGISYDPVIALLGAVDFRKIDVRIIEFVLKDLVKKPANDYKLFKETWTSWLMGLEKIKSFEENYEVWLASVEVIKQMLHKLDMPKGLAEWLLSVPTQSSERQSDGVVKSSTRLLLYEGITVWQKECLEHQALEDVAAGGQVGVVKKAPRL